MNTVNLIGRLTRDPELKTVGDRSICELRIAVNDGREDRPALFVDVSTFDKQADACGRYLAQGREVAVSGRLVYREWKAEDGSPRSKHSVLGRVEFLGSIPNGSEPEAVATGAADKEEIPF